MKPEAPHKNTRAGRTRPRSGLAFAKGNAKIGRETLTFSLPSGHSCPMALHCMAKACQKTGRITDGPDQKFRCFSASAESAFPSVRKSRWKNFKECIRILKAKSGGPESLARALVEAMDKRSKGKPAHSVRIHVGGDFFSAAYLKAWAMAARRRPQTIFYAYTKSISLWLDLQKELGRGWPANFRLTASLGGAEDHLVAEHGLPTVEVVFHPQEAQRKGLEIDHDDSRARAAIRSNFALLLHGCQKKGSGASAAIARLKKEKVPFGYRKKAA